MPQTQFIPLDEAVCFIIHDLNCSGQAASEPAVRERLRYWYRDMQMPDEHVLFSVLQMLVADSKIYFTGARFATRTARSRRSFDRSSRAITRCVFACARAELPRALAAGRLGPSPSRVDFSPSISANLPGQAALSAPAITHEIDMRSDGCEYKVEWLTSEPAACHVRARAS